MQSASPGRVCLGFSARMASRPRAVELMPNGLNSRTWPQRCKCSPMPPRSYTLTAYCNLRPYRAASRPIGPAPRMAMRGVSDFAKATSCSGRLPVQQLSLAQRDQVAAVAVILAALKLLRSLVSPGTELVQVNGHEYRHIRAIVAKGRQQRR